MTWLNPFYGHVLNTISVSYYEHPNQAWPPLSSRRISPLTVRVRAAHAGKR